MVIGFRQKILLSASFLSLDSPSEPQNNLFLGTSDVIPAILTKPPAITTMRGSTVLSHPSYNGGQRKAHELSLASTPHSPGP